MNFWKKKVDQSKFLRFFVVALSFCTKTLINQEGKVSVTYFPHNIEYFMD